MSENVDFVPRNEEEALYGHEVAGGAPLTIEDVMNFKDEDEEKAQN